MSASPLPRNDDAVTRRYQNLLAVKVIFSYSSISEFFKAPPVQLRPVLDFDEVDVVLADHARNCMCLQLRSFRSNAKMA